jgi:predicted enzyme involved in methoxymalonyl-ACP biosynthesis
LGRRVEELALAIVAETARSAGVKRLKGSYIPTKKNGLVVEHFAKLGFTKTGDLPDGGTTWVLDLAEYVAPELPMQIVHANDRDNVSDAASVSIQN